MMRNARKLKTNDVARSYRPAPHERAAVETYRARMKANLPPPALKVTENDGTTEIGLDHPDPSVSQVLLMDALGTTDPDFLDGLLAQLADAGSKGGKVDRRALCFMLSVVKGVQPRDQVEALLAAQMAAVQMATMTLARRLGNSETIPQQDSAERAFNKLARTFTAQVEALKRYRSRGDQTVRVEHVTVNEGGQAIDGNVNHGGRGRLKNEEPTHEPEVLLPEGPPLLSN